MVRSYPLIIESPVYFDSFSVPSNPRKTASILAIKFFDNVNKEKGDGMPVYFKNFFQIISEEVSRGNFLFLIC